MAYDQYNSYEAPGRAYYGRQNQNPAAPQTQGYNQQYSQGQDSSYYNQGGHDQYSESYADDRQWNQGQQQHHDQGYGSNQGYGQGQGHGGYDDGYSQSQSRAQQGRLPPQQRGYGQGQGQRPPQQHQQQQQQPRQKNYGPGRPIQANAPPPDRQNFGQPQPQQTQHQPRSYPQQTRSPPPQNFQQSQRAPQQQDGYPRSESRQGGYNRQDERVTPAESRAPPAPWNDNGGRSSPGPGGRPPPSAPWANNNGRSSPGPGRNSPAPGRNSPFEPIGGRPGARSRSERERIEAQRQAPMNEMRRDSNLALPMDNPFPTFPTKKAEAKKKMQTQKPIIEESMSKMSFDSDLSRPSLDSHRQNTSQTMPTRPGTSQGSRMEMPIRPGTAQGNGADRRQQQEWGQKAPRPPIHQQDSQRAPDGYHAPQQQGSWPLAEEPLPPQPQFSLPARPSTATGTREGPGPRSPPNGPSMNQQYARQPPQSRRRSTDGSNGHQADAAGYGQSGADQYGYNQSQSPPRQQGYGQAMSPPKAQPPQTQGYGAAYAQQPRETMGYSDFGANPYGDEPDFDAQPSNNRHEHAISMHLDGTGGPVQHTKSAPQQSGLRNGYSAEENYDSGYGHDNQQMYGQASSSQPDLRSQNGNYGYGNGGPLPNRGPGMGPRGRGMPPAPGGMGRGALPGRPGPTPMPRVQTGETQWSDPGPRHGSPMSPVGRMNGQAPSPIQNPDALPSHPTPVRPGHMGGVQNNRPPPVRQYNNVNTGPAANAATPRQSSEQNRSSADSSASNVPITHEELQRLQAIVKMDPSDHKTALLLAKRMIEAASSDLVNVHQDPKARQKAREKFIFDAHKMVKKLVAQQNAEAMFYLADCHGQGLMGLSPDPKEAFQLYQAAAKLGHPSSAYRTAVCCEMGADEGGGTRKDPLKAVQWYRRAASLGEPAAMYKLGMILLKGLLGQQRNVGEAVNWLQRASERADKDNPHALHELGLLFAAPPNDSKLIRDDKYAAQLFEQAARLGYKFSQFRLGEAFEYGLLSLPIDQRSSIAWYSKAAAQGEHQSELALSGWYLTGAPGILEQSDTEAYLWARKAAQAELPKGLFALGYFTEVGIGCPRSLEEAKKWYGRAAALRYPKAQERLEELKRGGYKAQKSRERLSRSDRKQQDDNCAVM